MDSAKHDQLESTADYRVKPSKLPALLGTYYCVLGWITVSWIVLGPLIWKTSLHIDLTFIVWFWLGSAIKRRSRAARAWAIAIAAFMVLILLMALVLPGAEASFGNLSFDRTHPEFYAITGALMVVLALPAVFLMTPRGAKAFLPQTSAEQADAG